MQQGTTRKRKPARAASAVRTNLPKRVKPRHRLHGRQQSKGAAPFTGVATSILSQGLTSKNIAEVLSANGGDHLLGSQEKQEEIVLFLYRLLENHPDFKQGDLGSTPSLSEVILYLIEGINNIAGTNWNLCRKEGQLFWKGVKEYDANSTTFYAVALCFLPAIKYSSPALHKMILKLIKLLHVEKNILLWEEDEESIIDYLENDIEENSGELEKEYLQEIKKEVKEFTTGEAAKYLKRIKSCKATTSELKQMAASYQAQDIEQEGLLEWIKKGIELLDSPFGLNEFIHPDYYRESEDEYPILPNRCLRFIWRSQGYVMENLQESLNNDFGEYGEVPLSFELSTDQGAVFALPLPAFPYQLCAFLEMGNILSGQLAEKYKI